MPTTAAASRSVVIGTVRSPTTSSAPRTAMREPSSNGGVPNPSPVGRSPMRPVRALRGGGDDEAGQAVQAVAGRGERRWRRSIGA